MGRLFANGPGDQGSIPGWVIPKTFKMVLNTSLLNTQHHKVHIEGKMEQSRGMSSALPLHLGVVAFEKGAFRSSTTKYRQLYFFTYIIHVYIYIYIYIYTIYIYMRDYRDIYSPTPVGLSSLANEVIVLPLAFIASLFLYELRSR